MINKDFLKEVLANDKKLMELKQVNYINVPKYDELSVTQLWPMLKDDAEFM